MVRFQRPDGVGRNRGVAAVVSRGEHEWITVKNRQWCLTCRAYQQRSAEGRPWHPWVPDKCPWDTPYAWRQAVLPTLPNSTAAYWPPSCEHAYCRALHAELLARMSDDRRRDLSERQQLFARSVEAMHSTVPCEEALRLASMGRPWP